MRPSIAFFLPTFNEADNVPSVAQAAINYLSDRCENWKVFVIDDGSVDDTVVRLQTLSGVVIVSHEQNKGYGAALRTGFEHALATDYDWIAFCDSDRQFNPADLELLLQAATVQQADVAIGYREVRADKLHRRVMGRGWHHISRMILGYEARDVDCGFKLFRREALMSVMPELSGDYATISPELIARIQGLGYAFAEVSVPHFPRQAGEQTGANLRVVLGSLWGLLKLRRALNKERMVPREQRDYQLEQAA